MRVSPRSAEIPALSPYVGPVFRPGANGNVWHVHSIEVPVCDVQLMDSRTGKRVRRGWAEGGLNDAIDSQKLMEARIDERVRRILEQLPMKG